MTSILSWRVKWSNPTSKLLEQLTMKALEICHACQLLTKFLPLTVTVVQMVYHATHLKGEITRLVYVQGQIVQEWCQIIHQ